MLFITQELKYCVKKLLLIKMNKNKGNERNSKVGLKLNAVRK